MEISQSQSSTVFSVRIVSIDYYMAPPIPGVDFCYSSFHGGKINEVPVIRIYGSTPAGQKTCLHVHQALPYLYVPCSELFPGQQQGEAFANDLCLAIEKSLKLKGNAGSKRQHVHGYSLVRAKRFYGYHLSEDVFVKIYLYYPHDVSRAANLLLGGAVLDKRLQPHESHIPFLLQFLIDYNLYGMGHLHLSKIKFRHPIPVTVASRKVNYIQKHGLETEKLTCTSADLKADPSDDAALHLPIWISSTIPGDWMWQFPSESDTSQDQGNHCKRQSVCELEGDTTVDEILNQQLKMFTSLSQTHSDVKMVQSLVSIWEEEYERTGMHQVPMPSDPSKPLPEEVLRVFSLGLDYEKKLIELCDKQDTLDLLTPSEKDEKFLGSKTSSSDQEIVIEHGPVSLDSINVEPLRSSMEMDGYLTSQGSLYKDRKALSVKKHGSPKLLSVNEKRVTPKGDDEEAIGLLSWLATSQAAEDINSDDELLRETILSPLFPAATFDKVLEKANVDYEHASQKECKDILDSTAELVDFEGFEERSFHPSNSRHSSLPSSENIIPQVDGAGDDMFQTPPSRSARMSPEINVKSKNTRSSKNHVLDDMLWGSLPITSNEKVCDDLKSTSFSSADACIDDTKDSGSSSSLDGKKRKQEDAVMKSVDSKKCGSKEKSTLVECPLRDLMRRKRCYRPEPLECGPHKDDKATSPGSLKDFFPEKSDSHMLQYDELNTAFNDSLFKEPSLTDQPTKLDKSCDINPASSDCSMDAKPPIFYRSDGPLQASSLDDGHFDSDIKVDETIGVAGSSQFGYFAVTGPSQVNKCPLLSTSMVISTEAEHKDLIGMTFCKRPPTADWTNEDTIFTHLLAISDASSALKEINIDKTSGRPLPDFLPFFVREGNTLANNSESDYPQEVTMGIPTHYQNDGSLLYLLTPVSSPPSADCVRRWLLCDQRDSSRRIGSEKSLFNKCDESMSRAGSVLQMRSINELEHQGDLGNLNVDKNPKDGTTIIKSGGGNLDVKSCSDWSLDISQISGPDGKSKCTPLSQRGFRDSASVGGGQQLTLLSIEVQAESRGDRRPDPQHDAVNVIALVIQNDDDPSVEVHVLLYSKADSFKRSLDGISGCNMMVFSEEKCLFQNFVKIICSADPDMLLGWDIQGGSLGYLAERASQLGIGLLNKISRIPSEKKLDGDSEASHKGIEDTLISDLVVDSDVLEDVVIEDEWGRTHASGVHVDGRIVLNVWRLMRSEVKLNIYTLEAVTEAVLRQKVPLIPHKTLTKWYSSGLGRARFRCIEYVLERAKLNLQIVNQLDMINRTSELARVFGIDFFSVLSRGSQYRVESMLLRLAHTQNYLVVSPGNQQVASQPAMECIPLVMEPESGFYADPVVVLDFQSLYPSMIIAYNLCFCTCLGKLALSKINTLGVSTYSPNLKILQDLKDQMLLTPNGVLYVPAKVRKGILPRLLEEILSTRIMVKQAMKKLAPSQQVLHRIFNARQLALKLIANVTYGYTAAGFSGRMPCAELADSIVQCGRSTLEKAILCVNSHDKWGAKVIYGDTDSMFVLLKGRSVKEAFHIGNEIASAITAMNPSPVTLKMEKVYHRCFLLTKKRYVGYSYENPEQTEPIFDAKGIETVRRDTCPAVAKTMEKSLRLFFEHQDILEVKAYLQRQWKRILSGRVSLQDFIFAKEVRLGTYRTRTSSSLPPAAIVATKAMRVDPRAEPRYAERVPYVVIHGEPGARLVDMVVDPLDLLAVDTPYRLNDLYYINKQIIPALQRVFGLVGANLNQWFAEMPRAISEAFAKHPSLAPNPNRTRIDYYYLSERCILCGELVQAMSHLCNQCSQNETVSAIALIRWTSKLEREMQHLAAICQHCGGDGVVERGIKCISLACSVFYERRKVQKELHGLVSVASDKDFYPKCNVEWF